MGILLQPWSLFLFAVVVFLSFTRYSRGHGSPRLLMKLRGDSVSSDI